jgi:hypothetical protein
VGRDNDGVSEGGLTADDLAGNLAGSAARRRAVELRAAAPVRSRLGRLLRVHTDERAYRIGADGEADVGRRLASLGPTWKVLHAIPLSNAGTDIDHLVIGPAGVFTINTKNHPGKSIWVAEQTFMVDGTKVPYLQKSVAECKRAHTQLSRAVGHAVEVRPVIVVMGAASLKIKAKPMDVSVIKRKELVRWLRSQPPSLGVDAIDEIYAAARQRSIWKKSSIS